MVNLKIKSAIYGLLRNVNKITSRLGFRIEVSNRTIRLAAPKFLSSISDKLNILDLGSESYTGDFDLTYKELAKIDCARIYCVDGFSNDNLKNVANGKSKWVSLDDFVGDGKSHTFYQCNPQSGSGIFPPDEDLWAEIGFPHTVVKSFPVDTKTLDDLLSADDKFDLIKMDIQGAEKMTLEASPVTVKNALVIQAEVDFIPLFKNTPLFAEVIQFFDKIGFKLFTFGGLGLLSIGDLKRYAHGGTSMFKSDYYYSRHLAYALCVFIKKEYECVEDAERAARTMHCCYHAYDVAYSLLKEYGSPHAEKYASLMQGVGLKR